MFEKNKRRGISSSIVKIQSLPPRGCYAPNKDNVYKEEIEI